MEFIEKKAFYITILSVLAIGIFIFWDFLVFQSLYLFTDIGSDTLNIRYPNMMHKEHYIATDGWLVKWSFFKGMGENAYTGIAFNPIAWLSLLLFGTLEVAERLVYVEFLKIVLIAICFYNYLKTIELSNYTAIVGTLLFTFSGYIIVGGTWHTHSSIILYGVFLLLAFEKLLKQNVWPLFPLAVYFIGASAYLYLLGIGLIVYASFRIIDEKGFDFKSIGILVGKMAAFTILGLALDASAMYSKIERVVDSPRVSGTASLVPKLSEMPMFGLEEPLHYLTLVTRFLGNDFLGNGNSYLGWRNYLEAPLFYCGLLTLLLFPQILVQLKGKKRLLYITFLGFWLVLLIFPYFRYAFYLFMGNYYKGSLSLFIPISFLFFAMQALNTIQKTKKINVIVLASSLFVLLIILFFPYKTEIDTTLRNVSVIYLLLYAALLYIYSFGKYQQEILIGILALVVLEVGYNAHQTIHKREVLAAASLQQKTGYNDFTVEALDYLKKEDNTFFRIDKDYSSTPATDHKSINDAQVQGYYSTSCYSSFNQKYYIRFLQAVGIIGTEIERETRWAPNLASNPLLQTFASVKYNLSKSEEPFYSSYGYAKEVATYGDVKVLENKYVQPLGFTYDKYITKKEFDKLENGTRKGIALLNSFVIEETEVQKYPDFSAFETDSIVADYGHEHYYKDVYETDKDSLQIESHNNNNIVGEITLDKPKLLFFSIPFDEGWQAIVDGKKADLQLVNIGFMGLPLEKGQHKISLAFVPPYSRLGIGIGIIALGIYLLMSAYWYRKVYQKKAKTVKT